MKINYYWINIDNSIYRKIFMELQFKLYNIDNKRISAVTPDNLSNYILDNPPYICGNNSCCYNNFKDCPLEYSCSLSHLEAIKQGYNDGNEYFIVCEDDIYFPFNINFEKIINNLPSDWEIFQMMVLDSDANNNLYKLYQDNINYIKYDNISKFYSTGMYLINRKGAEKILNKFFNNDLNKYELTNKTIIRQADFLIYMNANTYTSTFPFCYPNLKFISEIHPSHYFFHKESINKIKENINNSNNTNNFIDEFYNFDEFEKLFIQYI